MQIQHLCSTKSPINLNLAIFCWSGLHFVQSCTLVSQSNRMHKNYFRQVNEKFCRLRMATYRDGVKRKGDKIGMGL